MAQTDTLGSLYFLSDAQGSTRALTDGASGAVTSSYTYDAFGNLDGNALNAETHYLYTGQQFDPYTELYSLRARYYDPSVGRFLSRDTWAYNYQNPMELNRYVYGANNPVRYTDPSGYVVESALRHSLITVAASAQTGAAAGFAGSVFFYLAARLGACGDGLQLWAQQTNPFKFVAESTARGFVEGVKISVLAQLNPVCVKSFATTS